MRLAAAKWFTHGVSEPFLLYPSALIAIVLTCLLFPLDWAFFLLQGVQVCLENSEEENSHAFDRIYSH